MVFENPLEEHIALEIAREGIWVDPRKKVAYTAEEGHAFHVKDRAQGERQERPARRGRRRVRAQPGGARRGAGGLIVSISRITTALRKNWAH